MESLEKFLTFEIDNRLFAFDAANVVEVLINRPIEPIPKAADYIRGVINFRGEVVTVVDTSIKFGIKDYQAVEKRIIIVIAIHLDNKEIKLACLCDSVKRMEALQYKDIQQVPNFGNYYAPSLLKGVFYIKSDLYSIIDVEKIFSTDEILLITN